MIFNRLKPEHSTGRKISHSDAKRDSWPHKLLAWLENNIVGVLILVILLVILSIVTFKFTGKTLTTYFYFNSCLGEWSNTNHAEGPPTVTEKDTPDKYNLNNSAVLSRNIGGIFCGDLYGTVPQASTPKKAELRLSLALIEELDLFVEVDQRILNEKGQISPDIISEGEGFFDIGSGSKEKINDTNIQHKKTSINGDIFSGTIIDEEEPFIEIYFSYDDGKNWLLADRIGRANWKDLKYNIPFFDWNSLKNFQVSIHGIKRLPDQPDTYLDSVWLSVDYELAENTVSNTNFYESRDSGSTFKSEEFGKEEDPSFKVFEDFTDISCEIRPFTRQAGRGETLTYEVSLLKTGRDMPYRLSIGDAPDLILPRLIISNDDNTESVEILVDISAGAKPGTYSMVLLYEGLIKKSFFEKDNKYETTYCRFNLTVI